MIRRLSLSLAVLLLFGALTVVMTWPQGRMLGTAVPDSHDPLLSIWRLALVAVGVIGFVISLGVNSPFYQPLSSVIFVYRGRG